MGRLPSRRAEDSRTRLVARALGDFRQFCALLQIVPKGGERQAFRLNRIQRIFCANRTQRDIVLKPRQIGFTTLEQAADVHHFITRPGARVVCTVQSDAEHNPLKNISGNYDVFFDSLLNHAGVDAHVRRVSTSEWAIPSRDAKLRIIEAGASKAAAEKKGRGGTVTRLHVTETAFYEYAEETLNALFECVAGVEHDSEIVSESTANGAAGLFYEQCKASLAGESGFRFHFYPWFLQEEYQVPLEPGEVIEPRDEREERLVERFGCTQAQIKWRRRKLAEKSGNVDKFDQEYPEDPRSCFLLSGRAFFDRERTIALLAKAKPPIETTPIRWDGADGTLRVWHRPADGQRYVVSVDTAEGHGGDNGAATVWERGTGRHMATIWGQFKTHILARAAAGLGHRYNRAQIAVERNNHGHAVLQALRREQKYPAIFQDHDDRDGWITSGPSRTAALEAFEDAHRTETWSSPDESLLGEMLTFVVGPNGKAEASSGKFDDLVMSAAIGWAVLSRITAPVETRKTVLSPF